VGAPTFIPFLGAWIELKEQPMNAETEAYVAMAGPVAGTAASLLCYFVARSEGSDLLLALAYSGFFLNLFNLIPVPPLDGGRMTGVVSPKFWLVGAPVLIGIFLWRPSPMLVIVALLAAPTCGAPSAARPRRPRLLRHPAGQAHRIRRALPGPDRLAGGDDPRRARDAGRRARLISTLPTR
jgi:hypothetical protein